VGRQETLSDVLSEFARTMVTDFPIQAILDHLVLRIVEVLPITSAGVTLISPGRDPHHVAASDEAALRYEKLQTELGEGPCTVAYGSGEAVWVPDLHAGDARFPKFAPRAVEAGLVAVFAFPLRHGDNRLGGLDLYRESPGPLDDETMISAQTLADVAATYVLNAQRRDDARDSSDRYRKSALHDALTGLPNRVLLRQRLEHASLRARRSRKMIAILFIDLDRFKEVNDIYGHRTGDELLVTVGHRLQGLLRPGDTVARMSGDEFVVLCEDLDDTARTEALAERIVTALNEPFAMSSGEVNVSASVGIAFSGRGDAVPEQVLNDADEAMYQAKRAGGARHQLIDLRERVHSQGRSDLEADLRFAARRGELRVDYQPIVRTVDGEITAIEALLRWDHPRRGLISPTIAIPIAEESDLISEIGRWVLERACIDRNRLQQAKPRPALEVCVNVSPHQLLGEGYCDTVQSVLAATATPPQLLTLEMTESVYIEDTERARVVLADLKGLGLQLALDDFGTGYSSLGYLEQFPIDVVKIDQSFVARLGHEPASSIVRAVIDLAHALDMGVVAEGVETTAQHDELAALDCDSCQGFYFAPPMCVDDLERRLQLR
jgi:diguanylate cyclase (GGDEF)-like protein